jgi:hypothetical protein
MAAIPQTKTLPGVIYEAQWLPPKMCIYGSPGVGKSSFGYEAPNPIFLPTEAGIENMDVARFPVARTLPEFLRNLNLVADGDHDHKSVVIDTLNGVMELYYAARKGIPGDRGRPQYDFVGYGGSNGWKGVSLELKPELLDPLEKCKRRGMFVILLAHVGTYNSKNPFGDDIVKSGPAVNKNVWEVINEWLDVIGRAEYVYSTYKSGSRTKASTDVETIDGIKVKQRRLYFDGGMEVDAKARVGYELPPEMPLSWTAFASHLGNIKILADEVLDLWQYMPDDKHNASLAWLGVRSLNDMAGANRGRLSQIRSRLLALKAKADAEAMEQNDEEMPMDDEDPKPAA